MNEVYLVFRKSEHPVIEGIYRLPENAIRRANEIVEEERDLGWRTIPNEIKVSTDHMIIKMETLIYWSCDQLHAQTITVEKRKVR